MKIIFSPAQQLARQMRDATYIVCKNIFPLISDTTENDLYLELPNIFPKAPQLRSGDVEVKHPIDTTTEQHHGTLIEITIISPYKPTPNTTKFTEITKEKKYQTFKLK